MAFALLLLLERQLHPQFLAQFVGDLPQGRVGSSQSRIENRLVLGEDRIEVCVLCDALKRDVRDGLVAEAARDALRFVFQLEVFVLGGEQPLAGDGNRHPAGVDRDPAPAPLLRHIGGRARPAGWIKDEVAWVGGHEHATLDQRG